MAASANRSLVDQNNHLVISEEILNDPRFLSSHVYAEKTAQGSTKSVITGPVFSEDANKVTLDGEWALTEDHDLEFHILQSAYTLKGKTLIFQGEIKATTGDSVLFKLRQYENVKGLQSDTILLKGRWRADKYNRITFEVSKSKGQYDTLAFQGAWIVNEKNQIVYKYVKKYLKTKTREEKTIIFDGSWDIGRNVITYSFEQSIGSYFTFKAEISNGNLRAKDGSIRYSIGIAYTRDNALHRATETITIYGRWCLNKDLGITFEAVYAGGKYKKMEFGVEKLIKTGDRIALYLTDQKGGPLGVRVEFAKTFATDAEFFLALSRAGVETKVLGGIRIKF